MTPEDHRLLVLWQRNRDKGLPPHLRLNEPTTREDFIARLHEETMSMFPATVSERSIINERAEA